MIQNTKRAVVTITRCLIKRITTNSPTRLQKGLYAEITTSTGTEYIIERPTKKELLNRIKTRDYK